MYSKLFLLFTFSILSISTFAQQWYSTTSYLSGRYEDVYFVNDIKGWAVSSVGEILKTEDGGANWTSQHISNNYFRSAEFLDENIGFVGSLDSVLLRTDDGGDTWTSIEHLIPVPIPGICGLAHAGNNVYGVGLFASPAYFIKSTDKGQTWTHSDLSMYADGLVECHFIDENIGFIAGVKNNSGGVILKTTDGGTTWSVVLNTQNGSEFIWKLDFVDNQVAYGAIESFTGGPAQVVKSTDGGDTWTTLEVSPQYYDIQGIGFVNQDTGWVCPRHNYMFKTTDGGQTWNQTTLYNNINRYFRVNPNLMYAAGSYVHKYSLFPVATQEQNRDEDARSKIISSNPNPFDEMINFTANIIIDTNIRFDIFDNNGQLVHTIYEGRISKGKHQFLVNATITSKMKSGLYYAVLHTNDGLHSVKILKQ